MYDQIFLLLFRAVDIATQIMGKFNRNIEEQSALTRWLVGTSNTVESWKDFFGISFCLSQLPRNPSLGLGLPRGTPDPRPYPQIANCKSSHMISVLQPFPILTSVSHWKKLF